LNEIVVGLVDARLTDLFGGRLGVVFHAGELTGECVVYLLLLGVVMLLLKFLDIGPVAKLEWWQTLIPFGLAVAWWSWADWSGYTKRKAMDQMDQKKKERLEKQRQSMRGPTRR
jgi:small Trp-rich protein